MAAIGQRGKYAESQVKNWMSRRSDADATYDFYRFPDTRAGSFQVVPADFEVVHAGTPYLIEVKEVAVTDLKQVSRRLPAKNFSADKVARMAKRQLAGADCWVIVCFMPMKDWKLVPLSVFTEREPSWNLNSFQKFDKVGEVMEYLFGLPPR